MKYTVVIRQPVPETVQADLISALIAQFELSPEQASRLAARRSGRLMKPNTRRRADRLLAIYQSVGAQVSLEEVREDTTVLADPYAGERPGLVGPAGNDYAATGPLPVSGAAAYAGGAVAVVPPPLDDLTVQPAALAPVPMLGQVAMPDLLTTVIAPVEPAPVIPAAPSAEDAWADFTGSLASSSTTSVSEPEPEANVVSVEAAEERVERRRSSLSRSVLTAALLPLLLATVATVVTVFVTEPRLQRTLLSQNAQAVAVAVASNLDTSDQNTVYAQIDTLLKRSTVGFVQVELPDGTTFFRSKTPDTDGPLSVKVANWVQGHPGSSSFVQKGSAADAYRYQLGLLEQVGATSSEQANSLRKAIAEPANQRSSTTTYVLSRIGVSSSQQGDRVIGEPQDLQASNLLYNIAVGVPSNDAQTALRRNLLVIFSLSLLFFVVAALMAARTARRIVEPIERLVKAADAISMGDLERPVRPERNDEIGDLAEALERMRLSLEAAMERLRRRRAR